MSEYLEYTDSDNSGFHEIIINKSDSRFTNTNKLPDNWTFEFLFQYNLSLEDEIMHLYVVNNNETISGISIVGELDTIILNIYDKYSKSIPSGTFSANELHHIAIVWAKDYSVIIYVDSKAVIGVNMNKLPFKNYTKFINFSLRANNFYKYKNIKFYSSIKYNSENFIYTT